MIVLVGFMGAGKSTIGEILASRLGLPFIDSDIYIEQRLGRSIRDIFSGEGERYFRDIEHQFISELIKGPEAILALGGGAIEDPRTRAALQSARIVYLRVSFSEALARVRDDRYRPMLRRSDLDEVYLARLPLFEGLSTIATSTDGRRPKSIAMEILAAITRLPSTPLGTSSVLVSPVGGTYFAHVGSGLIDILGTLLPDLCYAQKAVLIESTRDRQVADRVASQLNSLGLRSHRVPMPDLQDSKSLEVVAGIAENMANWSIRRTDVVVAVGGEAICEVAGFVAATFFRGMPLVLVPTTLVAQADSSVGGKSAINLTAGRNLLGLIHQPIAVVSDVAVAVAGRAREFSAGLAEIVKHALISTSDLLLDIQRNTALLNRRDETAVQALTMRSIEVKADIVSRDERELGDRVYLNYGHTFSHAIEALSNCGSHEDKDPLAIGLMAAAYLAYRQGRLTDTEVGVHRETLESLGLPVVANLSYEPMSAGWIRDKKYNQGMRFVLLNGLGHPEGGIHASELELRRALSDLAQQTVCY